MVEPGSITVSCGEKILQSLLYGGARFNHCKLWRQDIQSLYNVEPGSVTVNKGDKIQTLYTVI